MDLSTASPLSTGNEGLRLGYHSDHAAEQERPVEIVLDLGVVHPVDAIALIPVRSVLEGQTVEGYGFPVRFRVDLSTDSSFRESRTVADESRADYPSPGNYPYFVRFPPAAARYARLVVTKRWDRGGRIWITALAEFMVLSGVRNVAAGAAVRASDTLTALPTWSSANLTDSQSGLGLPVSHEASPTNGFSSELSGSQDTVKWVQVDLGREFPIDEIQLIPAHPVDWPRVGFAFPVRFRIETAGEDREFRTLADFSAQDFLNPGNNVVPVRGRGTRARFVRLVVNRLFARGDSTLHYVFALAELQVFSGGRNVALHARVDSLDSFQYPPRPRWSQEYLVDGYASQNRLITLPDWFAGLQRRRELESRLKALLAARQDALDEYLGRLAVTGIGSAIVMVAVLACGMLWSRRARTRQIEQLRSQLARDLHDDIGGSLGSICLVSQMAREADPIPASVLADLTEIDRIASETALAMRDMVWLIDSGNASRQDLLSRMRQIAEDVLGSTEHTVKIHRSGQNGNLSLSFRRHVLFAFKEVLHNAAKHSGARHVEIEIAEEPKLFKFSIRDDGLGFDPASCRAGNGLSNLRKRANELQGRVRVQSEPGRGTRVVFEGSVA
jgi:signal transduction histidine kinase